jgi:hypothetical protein
VRILRWLPLLPAACAAVATILFVVQGGFGAGHGPFDQAIALLGFPAILLLDAVPLPQFILSHDFLLIIWFPAFVNAALLFALVWLVRAARGIN